MQLQPFKLKTFLLGFLVNMLVGSTYTYLYLYYPQHRRFYYAVYAVLLALALTQLVIYMRRKRGMS